MSRNEREEQQKLPFWPNKVEGIIRKGHFSISLLLFAFLIVSFLDVFFRKIPKAEFERFSYVNPIMIYGFVWGIIQTAILSFGYERNVFRSEKTGETLDVLSGIMKIALFFLFNMFTIYIGGVLIGNGFEKRTEILSWRIVYCSFYAISVIASFGYGEYITIKSDRKGAENDPQPLPKSQMIILLGLYLLSLVFMLIDGIVIEPKFTGPVG